MRILVADDELMSRRLLEKTMQRIGYEVTAVPNGQLAAAELCKPKGPSLALGLDHAGTGWTGSLPRGPQAQGPVLRLHDLADLKREEGRRRRAAGVRSR